jgi:hypothetical protein
MTIDPDNPLRGIFAMLFSVFLRKPALFMARWQQGTLYLENNNSPSIHWPRTEILQGPMDSAQAFRGAKVDRVSLAQHMLQLIQD